MKVLHRLQDSAGLPFPIVTVGNFDGLHLGHRAVLKLVKQRAQELSGTVVVLTFDPHPLRVLAPELELRFLSDPDEKLVLLEQAGVDVVVRLPFTREFAAQAPEAFMRVVLSEGLGSRELYVGQNFRFGHGRRGTIETLQEAAPRLGFTVRVISPVLVNGLPVSSTRIRDFIQSGAMVQAAELLGRPYVLGGRVIRGEGRGSGLGYPTANVLPPQGRVLPQDGVYAAEVQLDSHVFPAVTYIGTRPTFGAGVREIEAHLLVTAPDLYNREINVAFHERVRDDMVFDSPALLAGQMAKDVERTHEILQGLSATKTRVSST
ncbi:MAG TPA: bifunctional riboflavin kinase/FAD synthetase [Nitrospirales bacterium]|jgi:riboflavin kinase/FMN adenylyltransferase